MNKKNLIVLTSIIMIGSLLRLWGLGSVPPSPDWDEASLGYNAYSIMATGRDEYGKFLPVVLRSFDDYKPALYAYLIIPAIKIFGLNTFAVRLPSAIFGILTVIATYFLVRELLLTSFWQARKERVQNLSQRWRFWSPPRFALSPQNDESIALLASFLLAISPWHIQFSRIAFESNVAMGLNVFSILLFLKGLKRRSLLFFSAFIMGISIYMYQSEKVFIPLLFIILIFVFRKQLVLIPKKYLIASVAILFLISIPMIHFTMTNKDALARAKGVSIFSDLTPFLRENVQKLVEDKKNNDYLGLLLDNRRVEFVKSIIAGYLSHFDLNWLFITGDLDRHHAPEMGLLYIWELPFLLIGIYSLIFGPSADGFDKKIKLFVFLWFLAAPIPASITSGVPHAVRTLNLLPTFQIFTTIGIITTLRKVSSIKYKVLSIGIKHFAFGVFFLSLIFNFLYYLDQYFVQQNYFYSESWQYGYKETINEVKKIENKYDKIVVSNQPHLDQSYMFFLFYLKYPPSAYQNEAKSASGGFRENHKFGKFEFRPIEWNREAKDSKILYVGRPSDFWYTSRVIKKINFINGKEAIFIVEG